MTTQDNLKEAFAGESQANRKDYGMNVIEPSLRIKRIPEDEGIEECMKLGKKIADMVRK